MKELVVIVRREKSAEVKSFLSSMGLDYVSKTVKGRGKEGGLGYKTNKGVIMSLLPKTLIELVVIVRREKSAEVKSFLSSMGLDYVSKTVKGRGKEGGLGYKTNKGVIMSLLPKTLILTWVEEALYEEVIEKIMDIAHTGFYGDGKIFVIGGWS